MQHKSIVAILALGVLSVPAGAMADTFTSSEGMELIAVASEDSSVVSISGHTIRSEDVIFRILSPSNNLVKADQVTPDEAGAFATSLDISALTENGLYTIEARQGTADLYNLAVQVSVVDGMTMDTVAMISNFERAETIVGSALFKGGSLILEADAMEGSDIITINGQTDITNIHVTLKVTSPNGNVISTDQIMVNPDGIFTIDIMIGGPLWSQDGDYVVTAHQGMYETSVAVGVMDGVVVPEFGVMAALVLAAAIVSIVAVSARSRLSLVPRF